MIMKYLFDYHTLYRVIKMIDDRIKSLREKADLTQADLARKLNISRSGVNAWEMGISVPSTQYIVELSLLFGVSTDFLFGLEGKSTVNVSGLLDEDVELVVQLIQHLRDKNQIPRE